MSKIYNFEKGKKYFIMMVGPSGSGKSTLAEKIKKSFEEKGDKITLLSSDALRAELLGDINDQTNNSFIFEKMQEKSILSLSEGSVIYDATNINVKDRKNILQIIKQKEINCEIVAYVMCTPRMICFRQNELRERVVPDEVINKQIARFQIPIYQEGFNTIVFAGWEEYDFNNFDYMSSTNRIHSIYELMLGVDQDNSYHNFPLMSHCILTGDKLFQILNNKDIAYSKKYLWKAGFIHDIGKLMTRVKNDKGESSFYAHANVGTYGLLSNLDMLDLYSIEEIIKCLALINYHMDCFNWTNAKSSTVNAKIEFFGQEFYDELMLLHKCDKFATKGVWEDEQ
jgi:predicted kinase